LVCIQARDRSEFVTPDGKRMKIAPGETMLYQFIVDGSITVQSTNTYCSGVSLPLHQRTVADQSLVLTQVRFSLSKEIYLRSKEGRTAAQVFKDYCPKRLREKGLLHRWYQGTPG